MSEAEEMRFRLRQIEQLSRQRLFVAERGAPFHGRIIKAPDFNPPEWREIPEARREAVLRGKVGNTKLAAEEAERTHILRVLHPVAERKEVPRFSGFAAEFMETYAKNNNKPSEQEAKRSTLRCHLLPAFGHMPIDRITVREVEKLKARMLEAGGGRKRVNTVAFQPHAAN